MLVTIVGSLAAIFTAGSQLPQLLKIVKSKHTRDISLPTYVSISIAAFLWVIYGSYKKDIIIILTNAVTFVFVIIILGYKLKYK